MSLLIVGDKAPAFTLPDQHGILKSLHDFSGKWVVIYFYPKALTPGCTVQACALRDHMDDLSQRDVVVLGISADKPQLLQKFAEKERLPFTLLGDESHQMLETYGAWQSKSMYGRAYVGVARMTYLIDPEQRVRMVWPKVDPKPHLQQILEWLDKHQNDEL